MLFCHVTTGIEGAKNEDLLEKKGGDGFPHIVFMDAEGKVLAVHDGGREPADFAETGKRAGSLVALRAKAAGGDAAAKIELLVVELELAQVGDEEAGARLKDLGKRTPEQEKTIAELRSAAAVREIMAKVDDEAAQIAAGAKFVAMRKAGRPVPTRSSEFQQFWICVMYHAEDKKDVAGYEEALGALKARFGKEEGAKDFFKTAEDNLKTLKAEKK